MTYQKIDIDSKILGKEIRNDVIPSAYLRSLMSNLYDNSLIYRNNFSCHSYNIGLTDILDETTDFAPDDCTGNYTHLFDGANYDQPIDPNPETIGMQFSTPIHEPVSIVIPWKFRPEVEKIKVRIALRCDQMTGSMWAQWIPSQYPGDRMYPPTMPEIAIDRNSTDFNLVGNVSNIWDETSGINKAVTQFSGNIASSPYIHEGLNDFFDVLDTESWAAKVGITDDPNAAPEYVGVDGVNYYELTLNRGSVISDETKSSMGLPPAHRGGQFKSEPDLIGYVVVNFFGGINTQDYPGGEHTLTSITYLNDFFGSNPSPFQVINESNSVGQRYISLNTKNWGKYHYCMLLGQWDNFVGNDQNKLERLYSVQGIYSHNATSLAQSYGSAVTLPSTLYPSFLLYPYIYNNSAVPVLDTEAILTPVSKFTVYSISIEDSN